MAQVVNFFIMYTVFHPTLGMRWVEEHGMIMPAPAHLPAGKYKVVWLNRQRYPSHRLPEGGVVLTVTRDRWTLSDGATLHDGTRPSLTLPWLSLQSQN